MGSLCTQCTNGIMSHNDNVSSHTLPQLHNVQINNDFKQSQQNKENKDTENKEDKDTENMRKLNELLTKLNTSDIKSTEINSIYLLESAKIYSKHKNNDECKLINCEYLKRICDILKRYNYHTQNIQIQNIHINDINNICLLNDYNHLLFTHYNEFENIYNMLIKQCSDNKVCELKTCLMMRRNQRNRSNITKNENLLKEFYINNDNIVTQQLLDTIHSNYFHSFDIGYELTTKKK
eukprot:93021_1